MRSARALQGPRDGLTATILAAYYVFYRDAMIWYILLGDSRRKDLKISYAKRFLSSCYVFRLLVFPLSSIGGLCRDRILQLERESLRGH